MPDTPVGQPPRGPDDPPVAMCVSRPEENMLDVKAVCGRLEGGRAEVAHGVAGLQQTVAGRQQSFSGLRQSVTRIEATLVATPPHLATKAEFAEKPGKAWLVGLLAVPITAYAAGGAVIAILE